MLNLGNSFIEKCLEAAMNTRSKNILKDITIMIVLAVTQWVLKYLNLNENVMLQKFARQWI